MHRAALAGLLLCLAGRAAAEPAWQLGLHVASAHARGGYESATPGLYLRAPSGATLGLLRNSEGGRSAYVGHSWQSADRRWALTAGLVSGYRSAPVSPLLCASLRQPLGPGRALRLAFLPRPPGPAGSAALHLSLEADL